MESKSRLADVAVIVQTGSRASRGVAERIREEFGEELLSVTESDSGNSFEAAAERAHAAGAKVLAVGGGDGTIGKAADVCIKYDLALGIIPTGTGNALAHELGIPIDPIRALGVFEKALERRIDVGLANDRRFVTVATLGVTSKVAESLAQMNKSFFGRLAYVPAVVKAVREARYVHMTIEADGKRFEGRTMQLVVASGRLHGGPFPTTAEAAIDDGRLSVYAVATHGKWTMLRYGLYLFQGKQQQLPEVWSAEAKSVEVRLRKKRKFILDGDPQPAKIMRFRSEARVLRVLVPSA